MSDRLEKLLEKKDKLAQEMIDWAPYPLGSEQELDMLCIRIDENLDDIWELMNEEDKEN